jgi:hypothetical protein
MTIQISEECRQQISLFLPDALRAALTSYQEYVTTPGKSEGDKFKDYHVSCKAAVAHIELLLKLAKIARLPDASLPDQSQQAVFSGVYTEASVEFDGYKRQMEAKT